MILASRCVSAAVACTALAVLLSFSAAPSEAKEPAQKEKKTSTPKIDPAWLDKMDGRDLGCVMSAVGYEPAPFTEALRWIKRDALTWPSLRGKVVVIQSWTTRKAEARKTLTRTAELLADIAPTDLQIIGLHTPDMAATAANVIPPLPEHVAVVIDPEGEFCDALGIYQEPVNLLIDRNGTVRYAGLNQHGLVKAAKELVAEAPDPNAQPRPRPAPKASKPVEYPKVGGGPLKNVRDMRGKEAPKLVVQQWLTSEPKLEDKVVIIDFWATWCGPCRRSIPHLNELAEAYPDDVVIVGLSDEPSATIRKFMRSSPMKYAVATDEKNRLAGELRVKSIPHAMVISSDQIVR